MIRRKNFGYADFYVLGVEGKQECRQRGLPYSTTSFKR